LVDKDQLAVAAAGMRAAVLTDGSSSSGWVYREGGVREERRRERWRRCELQPGPAARREASGDWRETPDARAEQGIADSREEGGGRRRLEGRKQVVNKRRVSGQGREDSGQDWRTLT
jgi:hypothetical protein